MSCTARDPPRLPRSPARAFTCASPTGAKSSTPPAAPRSPASATAIRRVDGGDRTSSSTSSPMPIPASSPPRPPRSSPICCSSATRPAGSAMPISCCGGSEAIEAALKMARQYFVETRRAAAHATSSRAGRAITATRSARWRPAATDGAARRIAPLLIETHHHRLALLRLSLPARRARATRDYGRAPGRRAGGRVPARSGRDTVDRLHRRDRWSAPPPAACRRRPAISSAMREICDRHGVAADPRRGDVRHGPHRHAARLGAGRHRARHRGRRQGPGRRLPADRRACCSASAIVEAIRAGSRRLPARPYLSRRIRSPARRRWRCSR